MGKADALSRRSDHGSVAGDNEDMTLLRPDLFAIWALEGVTAVGEEWDILRDIRGHLQTSGPEDPVAKAVAELRKGHDHLVRSAEWTEREGLLHFRGRTYVPNDSELWQRIVSQHHDTQVAGHAGRWKTLELVSRNYWWPQMSRYMGQYVKTCDLCTRTKARMQPLMGELEPLPIPDSRWDTISVDFIVELPEAHGRDAV